MANTRKRMRLPNGFGRITELKNQKLRNKWRVMVTIGHDANGRPIGKLLKPKAYFRTYNEAYTALVQYNADPYDLNFDKKVIDAFKEWKELYYPTISDKTAYNYDFAWRYCSSTYNLQVRDIRVKDIRYCIEEGKLLSKSNEIIESSKPTPNVQKLIKMLWNVLMDYAVEKEYTDKNYARDVRISKTVQKTINLEKEGHIAFTEDELEKLWAAVDRPFVSIIIVQCYMGWRPNEMLNIRFNDVDLEKMTFIGGSKTQAGMHRVVPMHACIQEIITAQYEKAEKANSEYLFFHTTKGTPQKFAYQTYYTKFMNVITELDLNHKHSPHDPRKTFVTLAKKYKVDEYAIKRIVGHQITDITENVYTERDISWLSEEIEKIKAHA